MHSHIFRTASRIAPQLFEICWNTARQTMQVVDLLQRMMLATTMFALGKMPQAWSVTLAAARLALGTMRQAGVIMCASQTSSRS